MAVELPQEITDLQLVVAAAITGAILGRERGATDRMLAIAEAAVCDVYQYAPSAPLAILREASIRFAGWMAGSRPHATSSTTKDPGGTEISLTFHGAATANGLRASGASSMLSRYRVRRAGAISG